MSSFIKDLFGKYIYDIYTSTYEDIKLIFEELNYIKLYNQHKV